MTLLFARLGLRRLCETERGRLAYIPRHSAAKCAPMGLPARAACATFALFPE